MQDVGEREIRVAHSPDSDDAFMFYALARQRLDTGNLRFNHELKDIETLNRLALEGRYDVSAISFHAYAYVADKYALMPCGASMGNGYGPIVVSREELRERDLRNQVVAVPGTMTTAYLALKLFEADFQPRFMAFDRILEAVSRGEVRAGLIIHEGQLTYHEMGLKKILDLGQWWYRRFKLPLPLGGNVILRDLGTSLIRDVCYWVKESILYSLSHRDEAVAYALQYARGLDAGLAGRFIDMYVNEMTVEYSEESRRAVALLLEEGGRHGIIPKNIVPEFVESS